MGKMGLLGICFPEKYGGAGMDYLALAIACEELERGDISLRTVLSVHIALTSCTIYQWGNDKHKEKLLKEFLGKVASSEITDIESLIDLEQTIEQFIENIEVEL